MRPASDTTFQRSTHAVVVLDKRLRSAAAIPEVVRHGVLVEPDNVEALADGIWRLWRDPALRSTIQLQQRKDVEEFEMIRVTRQFLREVERVARPAA